MTEQTIIETERPHPPDVAPVTDEQRVALPVGESTAGISVADLLDRDVYGSDEEEIGPITDLYVDALDHTLRYATLEIGGFLGIGARTILVPFTALEPQDDRLVLPVTRETLEAAPELEATDRAFDREYEERVLAHWGSLGSESVERNPER
jgi:hypothetical protein